MLAPWPIGDKRTCQSDLCNNALQFDSLVMQYVGNSSCRQSAVPNPRAGRRGRRRRLRPQRRPAPARAFVFPPDPARAGSITPSLTQRRAAMSRRHPTRRASTGTGPRPRSARGSTAATFPARAGGKRSTPPNSTSIRPTRGCRSSSAAPPWSWRRPVYWNSDWTRSAGLHAKIGPI